MTDTDKVQLIQRTERDKKQIKWWYRPATCRVCTAAGLIFDMCTALSSSLLHKTVHKYLDLLQPAPSSQYATPETDTNIYKNIKGTLISTFIGISRLSALCVCVYFAIRRCFFLTLTSPEASSTMRCCAASSGRAWSSITSNFTWSTFAIWTHKTFSIRHKWSYLYKQNICSKPGIKTSELK